MKLIDVVEMRNRINKMIIVDKERDVLSHLEHLRDCIGSNLKDKSFVQSLAESHDKIVEEISNMRQQIVNQKKFLDHFIENSHDEYFAYSDEIYKSMKDDLPEYIFERYQNNPVLDNSDVIDLFVARLGQYVTWKKPGLDIHPLYGDITDNIKGMDPLYLVDTDEKMLFNCKTRWHDKYQKRLRYYTIDETAEKPLSALPKSQFGLVVSVGFFNYKPKQIIFNFLQNVFDLLCEGGVFVFTYNNCELPKALQKVDNFFMTYMTKSLLIDKCKKIGYEVIKTVDASSSAQWIELKKPGTLSSLRGGQTLAEIVSLSHGEDYEGTPHGCAFPENPSNGELFIKNDVIPPLHYRWIESKQRWIELEDDQND